jgi:hypothetical protein
VTSARNTRLEPVPTKIVLVGSSPGCEGIRVDPPRTQHVVPGSEPLAEGARDLFARLVWS